MPAPMCVYLRVCVCVCVLVVPQAGQETRGTQLAP